MVTKKLVRPVEGVKLAGVCAGIANYFDLDVTLVRVLYAGLTVFSVGFPGVLLYLFLMLIMPKEGGNKAVETSETETEKTN